MAANPDREGRVHGYSDFSLTDIGVAQAQAVADLLSAVPVDAVVTSDLARARQTALIIAGSRAPVLVDARLREVDIGDFDGMTLPRLREVDARFIPWLEVFFNGRFASSSFHIPWTMAFPGGESVESMSRRILPALRDAAAAYQGKTVVVVSHGWAIQSMLCHVTGSSLSNYYHFAYANCMVTMMEVDDGGHGALVIHNGNMRPELAVGARWMGEELGAAAGSASAVATDRAATCRVLLVTAEGAAQASLTRLLGGVRLAAIRASSRASSTEAAVALRATSATTPEVDRAMEDPALAVHGLRGIVGDGLGSTVALIAEPPVLSRIAAHVTRGDERNVSAFPALAGGVGLVEVEADGRGMLHVWNGDVNLAAAYGQLRGQLRPSRSSDHS